MSTGQRCYNCGKGIMVGHNVSHAKNRTRKVFKPNLHSSRIKVDGTSMKVKLCTKCLRQIKNPKLEVKKTKPEIQDISSTTPAVTGLA